MSACWRGKEKPRGPGAARGKSGRAGREMALPAVWRSAGFGGTELTRPEYLRQWVCFTLQVVDFKYKPKAAFYTGGAQSTRKASTLRRRRSSRGSCQSLSNSAGSQLP